MLVSAENEEISDKLFFGDFLIFLLILLQYSIYQSGGKI